MTRVLVFTNTYDDVHVDRVRSEIEAIGGTLCRFDTDLLVQGVNQVVFRYQNGSCEVRLTTREGELDLNSFDSFWFRKPYGFGDFGFAESIKDPVQREAAKKEVTAVLEGLFSLLGDRFWLNPPAAIIKAKAKTYQLAVATELGLNVPQSLITNDPYAAKAFCELGPTVFKPLAEPVLRYDRQRLIVEPTLLTDAHIGKLDLIKPQPVLLQRYIDKRYELRVTYIGGKIFVARQELTSQLPENKVDWRSLQGTEDSVYRTGKLTPSTALKVQRLMQILGLGFGALDFAVDQEGNEFFLEVNPNGQWLGYTDEIGLPAAAEFARCLVTRTDGSIRHGR